LKPPRSKRLKQRCVVPLSNFAFNFNLGRYMKETFQALQGAHAVAEQTKRAAQEAVRAARREQGHAERLLAEKTREAAGAGAAAAAPGLVGRCRLTL